MSKNNNRSRKSTTAKPTNNTTPSTANKTATSASETANKTINKVAETKQQVTDAAAAASKPVEKAVDNTKATMNSAVDKATEKVETKATQTAEKITQISDKAVEKTADAVTTTSKKIEKNVEQSVKSPAKSNTANQKTPKNNTAESAKRASNTAADQTTQQTAKTANQSTEPNKVDTKPVQTAQPAPKSNKLGTLIAFLLGAAGTGLGSFALTEVRALKANDGNAQVIQQVSALESQLKQLSESSDYKTLQDKLANVASQATTIKTDSANLTERLAQVEQMQNGLGKSIAGEVNGILDKRMSEVDSLLQKVKEIELGQQGLTQNVNAFSAASQAITTEAMQKQEVGYLLRMAHYKLQSEGDVMGAMGMLKIAEDKQLAVNEGQSDGLVDAVRQKVIQLQGVKPVDTDAMISQLKSLSRIVPELSAKVTQEKVAEVSKAEAATAAEEATGVLNKIGAVIASGVKYTPKDPSKIDISAETILIEKRLLQADLKTAELAVRSHNKVLLAESIRAVRDSLGQYFADSEVKTQLLKGLATIEQSELENVLPDLSGLVRQFENTQ